jgi:geranylgeranyl diphosphate synthase type II
MNFEHRSDVTETEYLEMIRLKTAVLVGFSLWLGARLAGATPAEAEEMYNAGEQMGLGFQLYDDYLDTFGDPALTGKQPGGDIRVSKKTWLLLHTLHHLPDHDHQTLLTWLQDRTEMRADAKVAAVSALMQATGADTACQALSDSYYHKGIEIVKTSGSNVGYRDALLALTDKLMRRES